MLHADESSQRRIALLSGSIALLLGGFALTGLVQRFMPEAPRESITYEQQEFASLRAEARKMRAVRRSLAALGKQNRFSEAAAAADAFLMQQEHAGIRQLRAEALLQSGEYEQGIAEVQKALGSMEEASGDPVEIASRLAIAGDREAFRTHCDQVIAKLGQQDNLAPMDANNTAWACIMMPDALPSYTRVVELAAFATEQARGGEDYATYLNTYAAALYRAGDYPGSVERMLECENIHSDRFNWPFLAMAYARQGNAAEANRWLRKLSGYLASTYATPEGQGARHELLWFWREAKATLAQNPGAAPAAAPIQQADSVATSK